MSFSDSINRIRDRNIIRLAYNGKNRSDVRHADRQHVAKLRTIGREAAASGLPLSAAYAEYDDWKLEQEAVDDEQLLSGEVEEQFDELHEEYFGDHAQDDIEESEGDDTASDDIDDQEGDDLDDETDFDWDEELERIW
jgi:hypothetical protein